MTPPRDWLRSPPEPTDFGGGSQLKSGRLPRRLWKRPRLNLPPLTTQEAILVIEVLERITRAIWRANGQGIADLMGRVDPETMYSWYDPDECEIQAESEPLSDF